MSRGRGQDGDEARMGRDVRFRVDARSGGSGDQEDWSAFEIGRHDVTVWVGCGIRGGRSPLTM